MPIIIKHGFSATAELGRQAGQAQGEAAAAAIDREATKSIWDAFQKTADAFVRRREIDEANARADKQRAEDRQFARDQQDRAYAHSDAAQERGYLHADESQARAQEFSAQQSEKNRVFSADEASKAREQNDRHFNADFGLRKQAQEDITSDRQTRRYTDLMEADARGEQQRADANLKAARADEIRHSIEQEKRFQEFGLEGLKSEFTNPDTGELEETPLYMLKKGQLLSGNYKAFQTSDMPGQRGGSRDRALNDSELVDLAATMPEYTIELANKLVQPKPGAGGRPLSGIPTGDPKEAAADPNAAAQAQIHPDAMRMLQAIPQVVHLDRFRPSRNPDAFNELQDLELRYRAAGAPESLIAPIIEQVDAMKNQRAMHLIPEAEARAQAAAASAFKEFAGNLPTGAQSEARAKLEARELASALRAARIRPAEYREWATRMQTAQTIFNLEPINRLRDAAWTKLNPTETKPAPATSSNRPPSRTR